MKREPRSLALEELKAQGHRIIDSIVELGCRQNGKGGVYARLARKLKVEEPKAHFSRIHTVSEAMAAVKALHQVREDIVYRNEQRKKMEIDRDKDGFATHQRKAPQEPKPKVVNTLPNKTLSQSEMKEALAKLKEVNEKKKKPWWTKLIHMVISNW